MATTSCIFLFPLFAKRWVESKSKAIHYSLSLSLGSFLVVESHVSLTGQLFLLYFTITQEDCVICGIQMGKSIDGLDIHRGPILTCWWFRIKFWESRSCNRLCQEAWLGIHGMMCFSVYPSEQTFAAFVALLEPFVFSPGRGMLHLLF